MKIINEVSELEALQIKHQSDKKHRLYEQKCKKDCFWGNIIVCTMVFVSVFAFMMTFSMITEYYKEWYSWLIATGISIVAVVCTYICMDLHFVESELDIASYPSQYLYWYYKNNFNIVDFDLKEGITSSDKTLWLVLENKETKEISRKYAGNFNIVEKTNIEDMTVDLKENKYYIPYKKAKT